MTLSRNMIADLQIHIGPFQDEDTAYWMNGVTTRATLVGQKTAEIAHSPVVKTIIKTMWTDETGIIDDHIVVLTHDGTVVNLKDTDKGCSVTLTYEVEHGYFDEETPTEEEILDGLLMHKQALRRLLEAC